jgi:OOP family OmpA-OmpF porin
MKKAILITMVLAIGLSTELAKADFTFGEPTNLGASVNSSNYDAGPSISSDGLSLFFYSLRSGGFGGSGWERLDLWVSTRETTTGDWETPTDLGSTVNSSTMDGTPCISSDGLSLFFDSWRSGGSGQSDIWMTTRATIYDPWGTPVNLGTMVNSSASDIGPCISADGLELYFGSDRTGGSGDWDIWITRRATVSDAWGPAENLGSTVNSPVYDGLPAISPDGKHFGRRG